MFLLLNDGSISAPQRTLERILLFAAASAIWVAVSVRPARGADWVFEHSYYSHADSPGYTIGLVPQTRSAYRQAYVNLSPHARLSGGWRWNNYQIQNGNSFDSTYMREFYIDSR